MKKIYNIILVICCIAIFSCKKDQNQKLVSEIAGEYNIESFTKYRNGQATPVNFTKATINFESCTLKDGIGGNCTGWYKFDDNPKVTFNYKPSKDYGFKDVYILGLSSFKEPELRGDFKFVQENGFLLLNGIENSGSVNGVVTTSYSDLKLIKK
jgi:hypothetical protein